MLTGDRLDVVCGAGAASLRYQAASYQQRGPGGAAGSAQTPCTEYHIWTRKLTYFAFELRLVDSRCGEGRGAAISCLIYILRGPRQPTFHEVNSSCGVVQRLEAVH